MSHLEQAVLEALEEVHDPCSVAAGRPLGMIGMGLLTNLEIGQEGEVSASLRMTFPGCMMMPTIAAAVEDRLNLIPGIGKVTVLVDTAMTWTPNDMNSGNTLTSLSMVQSEHKKVESYSIQQKE